MTVTLRDIAEKAGVSVPTVSRALRNTSDALTTEETRQRIVQIAEELGYRPNRYAQALSSGKASLINLVVRHAEAHVSNVKILKLQTALGELGLDVMATDFGSLASAEDISEMLLSAAPQAVVFLNWSWDASVLPAVCESLQAGGACVLSVDPYQGMPAPDVPCDAVRVDRSLAVYLAVSHLIERGHRCIGLLRRRDDASGRFEGYERAVTEHGITDRFVEDLDPAEALPSSAERGIQRLLERNPQVTGLVCCSDLVAVAAMRGLHRMGFEVPGHVAVVGFDNDPWTAYLPVSLTTVAQPVDELCSASAEFLRERLQGGTGPWQRLDLKPRVIVRESTGGNRARRPGGVTRGVVGPQERGA